MECVRLRINDVDSDRVEILVSDSKGGNYDIRTAQELLGHKDASTTMIYTPVLNKGGNGALSPLDQL